MRLLKRISVCFMSVLLAAGFCACAAETPTETARSFTVSFDVCAPDGVKTNKLLDQTVEYGNVIDMPKVVQRGTDSSYFIVGWYEDSAYTKEWDFDIDGVQNDLTLYAKWGRQFTVEYYSNQSLDEAVHSETVKEGRKAFPSDDVFVGHKVNGYYLDAAHTQPFDKEAPVVSDLKIYADTSDTMYFDAASIKKNFTNTKALSDSSAAAGETLVQYDAAGEAYAKVRFGVSTKADNACLIIKNANVDMSKSPKIRITFKNLGSANMFRIFFIVKDENGNYLGRNIPDNYDGERLYDYTFTAGQKNMKENDDWAVAEIDLAAINEFWRDAYTLVGLRIDGRYKAQNESDDTNVFMIKSIEGVSYETGSSEAE